jgi:MoxR-like ATPase
MRPSALHAILATEFDAITRGLHTPLMIWGAPGIGKSQIVAEAAAHHQAPLIDIRLSQMEPSDLRGIPFRDGNHVVWAPPAMLPQVARDGEQGILFLDEINSAAPTVSASAYQLVLDRRIGDYQVPPGWLIIAAGNRQGDRGVTYTMPAPLANRFSHVELEVNLDDWMLWAWKQGIDDRVIAFLRFKPELLFVFEPEHSHQAFPTPRTWEFTSRALQKFADTPDLLREALPACVGAAAGVELYAFVEHLKDIPDIDGILEGKEHSVPEAIDLQYAVASALVGRAVKMPKDDSRTIKLQHIFDYAQRFPGREMGVMLISDLHRLIGQDIFAVPGFSDWAKDIADIILYE